MSRVREFRKELKLSQQAFGELVGLKQNSISMIEQGKRNLSIKKARQIIEIAKEQDKKLTLDELV